MDEHKATLRDQLAMAALQGLAAPLLSREADMVRLARAAYRWADEMLEARAIDPGHLKDLARADRRLGAL